MLQQAAGNCEHCRQLVDKAADTVSADRLIIEACPRLVNSVGD